MDNWEEMDKFLEKYKISLEQLVVPESKEVPNDGNRSRDTADS